MKQQKTAREKELMLATIIERLREYQPERIILLGSYATGLTDEYSDLDLVVIKTTEKRFMERLVEVSRLIGTDVDKVDVLVYSPEEWERMKEWGNPFAEEVVKKGKVVYEKK